MLRSCIATIALVLLVGPALAQFPSQPPPVSSQGNERERAACHPDVIRYCKQLLREDGQDDVFAILGCLQQNRSKISQACQTVLASHGQ